MFTVLQACIALGFDFRPTAKGQYCIDAAFVSVFIYNAAFMANKVDYINAAHGTRAIYSRPMERAQHQQSAAPLQAVEQCTE